MSIFSAGTFRNVLLFIGLFMLSVAAVDIQQGLIYDKVFRPLQPLAKPGYLKTVTDPAFGTTIRRITNADSGGGIVPAYSTIPAWNCDESYLLLYSVSTSVHKLYKGKTYAYIKDISQLGNAIDIEQFNWSTTDPDILYYPDKQRRLMRLHISTGQQDVVHDFSSAQGNFFGQGDDPMYACSWDNNIWAFELGYDSNSSGVCYRLDSNKVYSIRKFTVGANIAPNPGPSGKRFYLEDGGAVCDINLNILGRFTLANPAEHASVGCLANGHDCLFTCQYDDPIVGTLIVCDMTDLTIAPYKVISQDNGYPYPTDGHISAMCFQHPGFIVLSAAGPTTVTKILDQEIVLADANSTSGKICRVCHARSWGKSGPMGYWAEPHAVPSPSGTRIAFASDWEGTTMVDTYVAELPAYTSSVLINKGKTAGGSGTVLRASSRTPAGSYSLDGRLVRRAGSALCIGKTQSGYKKITEIKK